MLPAHERLGADERVALQREQRLVEQPQLALVERAAQVRLRLQPLHERRAHLRVEHLEAALAAALRAVHRGVGVAQHLGRARLSAFHEDDADADAEVVRAPVELERLRERLADPLGDADRLRLGVEVLAQDHELVAAEARDGVADAQPLAQPRRQRDEQLVAGSWPRLSLTFLKSSTSQK